MQAPEFAFLWQQLDRCATIPTRRAPSAAAHP
jgi:hypothetical protein